MPDFPTFAIVTPSLNQADFIGETIESVITQKGDFYIDYVIMDGLSSDHSVEVIKEYERKIKAGDFNLRCRGVTFNWVSQKDRNKYDAINEGFRRVRGDYMAWINSDDLYMPWAFSVVCDVMGEHDDVRWLTSMYPMSINGRGQSIRAPRHYGFNGKAFFRGMNLPGQGWFATHYIQQDTVFWRRELWDATGATLDTELKYGGDFELWARFFQHANPPVVTSQISAFRFHEGSEIGGGHVIDAYAGESRMVLERMGGKPYGRIYSFLRKQIAWRLFAIPILARLFREILIATGLLDRVTVVYQDGVEGQWILSESVMLDTRLPYV